MVTPSRYVFILEKAKEEREEGGSRHDLGLLHLFGRRWDF
jgi:hypothetical protein